jgi:hypothetical protein
MDRRKEKKLMSPGRDPNSHLDLRTKLSNIWFQRSSVAIDTCQRKDSTSRAQESRAHPPLWCGIGSIISHVQREGGKLK